LADKLKAIIKKNTDYVKDKAKQEQDFYEAIYKQIQDE